MIDLDAIEQAARAARDNAYIVQTESLAYAQFLKEATPGIVLALVARLRAAEVIATAARAWCDDPSAANDGALLQAVGLSVPPPKERTAEPHSDGDFSYLCGNPYCRCYS